MKMNNMNLLILNSPWPLMMMVNMMMLTTNMMMKMNKSMDTSMFMMMTIIIKTMMLWVDNTMMEKMMTGMMNKYSEMTMKPLIWIIMMTESMFFLSFFYVNMSMMYFNNFMFNFKFNLNMFKLNFMLSLANLMILLTSSMTMMMFVKSNKDLKNNSVKYLSMTMILGMYFIAIQSIEYLTLNFNISNSIFFSNFFTLTMFHMTHVLMGSIMMMYMKVKKKKNLLSNKTKFKMLCWYWHFVDLVWLLIFIMIYTKYFINMNKYN